MFFRLKKSGERGYVQIVENKRDGAAVDFPGAEGLDLHQRTVHAG